MHLLLMFEQDIYHVATSQHHESQKITSLDVNSIAKIVFSIPESITIQNPKSFITVIFLPPQKSVVYTGMKTYTNSWMAQHSPREGPMYLGALTLRCANLELKGMMVLA